MDTPPREATAVITEVTACRDCPLVERGYGDEGWCDHVNAPIESGKARVVNPRGRLFDVAPDWCPLAALPVLIRRKKP